MQYENSTNANFPSFQKPLLHNFQLWPSVICADVFRLIYSFNTDDQMLKENIHRNESWVYPAVKF